VRPDRVRAREEILPQHAGVPPAAALGGASSPTLSEIMLDTDRPPVNEAP
jgi:hypothetical protein